MEQELQRAQIIINEFRKRVVEVTEDLIAERVAHEQTRQQLLQVIQQQAGDNGNA